MRYIFPFMIILLNTPAIAQDPEFSQFYSNPIYLNPAMAGANGCPEIHLNNRDQWMNISGAYVTNSVTYDAYAPSLRGGLAFMITNDMAGQNTLNWTTVNLAYAYHLQLSANWKLQMGGQTSWNQKFLDWNKLSFGDQIHPKDGFVYRTNDLPSNLIKNSSWSTRGFFDVSAGFFIHNPKFYAGFAAKHLNEPNQSMTLRNSELSARYTFHAGFNYEIGGQSPGIQTATVYPNFLYTCHAGAKQWNLGCYVHYRSVTFGAWVREGDAFILSMGVETGVYKIGYSYDATISTLTNASGGSHEISLSFSLPCKEMPKLFRTVNCPSF